ILHSAPGTTGGTAIEAAHVRHAEIADLKIDSSGGGWQTGILVDASEVRIVKVEIAGLSGPGIEVRGESEVSIEDSHIHGNAGPGVVVRDHAAATMNFNHILGNGTAGKLPAIQIASTQPSRIVGNYLDAAAAVIWQPVTPSKQLLEHNFFGP